jgi:hypothetical protein
MRKTIASALRKLAAWIDPAPSVQPPVVQGGGGPGSGGSPK